MDSPRSFILHLLISISSFLVVVRAHGTESVLFLDSPNRSYFRAPSVDLVQQVGSISSSELAAAVSVLLGSAPPASLSDDSASKLGKLLTPNPFDKPHAVLLVEVRGDEALKQSQTLPKTLKAEDGALLRSKLVLDSSPAVVQLAVEDEVSVVLLDEPLDQECDSTCIETELNALAKLIDGSYVGSLEQLDGKLTFPFSNSLSLELLSSKKADLKFILNLVGLIRNIRKAMDMHKEFSASVHNPAEIIMGSFQGVQVLEEEYGLSVVSEQGMNLFLTVLTKIFGSMQASYNGQLVGVVVFNNPSSELGDILNVGLQDPVARQLEEVPSVDVSAIVAGKLVTVTTAWISAIILVISTIIGVVFLLNMPLTRDTLLYSNVKLD